MNTRPWNWQQIINAAHTYHGTWESRMVRLSEQFEDATPATLADAMLAAGAITDAQCDAVHAHGFDFEHGRVPAAAWNDGELTYLAALVRTGGDSPRVPADAVDSYLDVQHAGARRDRRPDVCECITLLMMVRAYVTSPTMPTDDEVVSDLWRAFWERVHGGECIGQHLTSQCDRCAAIRRQGVQS